MKDEFAQEIIRYTLGEVNEELNRKFFDLRNKIFNSVEYSYDEYNIYGTVISKDELKIFENNFYPVIPEDLNVVDLLEEINFSKGEIFVENLFLKESLGEIKELENRPVSGVIKTDTGEYKATFRLVSDKRYFNKIETLFRITEKNKINYKVINIPYISKFMSVYLTDYDKDILKSSKIKEIIYDLDVPVLRGHILCWNIKEKEFDSEEYIKPAEEILTYEYKVKIPLDRKYLLNIEKGELMLSYLENHETLVFVTGEKTGHRLKIWEILDKADSETEKYLSYKVYSNEMHVQDSGNILYYKESVAEFVDNLGVKDDIVLSDIKFEPGENEREMELLNFMSFLKEEFEMKNKRSKVYLKFDFVDDYLKTEIISYIITALNYQNKDFEFSVLEEVDE